MIRFARNSLFFSAVGLLQIASTAARAADCSNLKPAAWLLGEWHAHRDGSELIESWNEAQPDRFEGAGSTLAKADGSIAASETLRLRVTGSRVFYLVTVRTAPLPVPFEMTGCSAMHLVFENASHDFPKRIEYSRIDANHMSRRAGDENRSEALDFTRRSKH